jgi:hypothetical protein
MGTPRLNGAAGGVTPGLKATRLTSPPSLGAPRSPLLFQMDDVLQRLNAHGAAMKQNKRPRAEGSSAGARPVCPRVDTPSSSQGQGTQFMNGRRAETRLHSDPSPGYGQRGNGQQHNGA